MIMSQELEEQQRLTNELKEQLRSLEADRVRITEQIKILEAKLVVQELRNQVTVITEENNQLQARKHKLQEKLESQEKTSTSEEAEEQVQVAQSQEENPRTIF
jgi:regulator of replication initiation timing